MSNERVYLMKRISALITMLLYTVFASTAHAETSAFYIVTNKVEMNTIIGYQKQDTGQYIQIGEFPTNGLGTGDLEIPAMKKDPNHPLANGDDPLISANSLVATKDRKHALVVNPGSASISLLAVNDDLSLTALDTAPSSDQFPISLAVYGNMVVAASVGETNSAGSISAYHIVDGKLEPVEGSRRDLKARPSTIAFSSDGEHVIVNELVTGMIKVFTVEEASLSATPKAAINSPRASEDRFQAIPVGFEVRGNGGDDVLLVSEARFLTPDFKLRPEAGKVALSPLYSWQTGSLSTYALTDAGDISILSADVLTGDTIEGGQIANCWVALSHDGSQLYAANALSSSISRYNIDKQGHAFLDVATAYKEQSELLFFSDLLVSRKGDELYQLVGNTGQVMIFSIDQNGDLTLVQTVGGLPELGTYGMIVY